MVRTARIIDRWDKYAYAPVNVRTALSVACLDRYGLPGRSMSVLTRPVTGHDHRPANQPYRGDRYTKTKDP